MRISDSSPLSSHIAWAGGTDNPQDWLKSGSVFLSLSEYEGYPLAPLEALVTGVPSVLSDIPGHEPFRNYSSVVSINAKTHASSAVTEIIKASQSDFCGFRSSYWENTQKLRDTHSLDIMVNDYQAWYQTYLPNK
jgi:glycosyltransferase involved in cell wall biosynthesis